MKIPGTIIIMPIAIDDEHSRRHARSKNVLRVLENIILLLIIPQFDPCIVLGAAEHHFMGIPAIRRKFVVLNGPVCTSQAAITFPELDVAF